jgi:hypothetical protein
MIEFDIYGPASNGGKEKRRQKFVGDSEVK